MGQTFARLCKPNMAQAPYFSLHAVRAAAAGNISRHMLPARTVACGSFVANCLPVPPPYPPSNFIAMSVPSILLDVGKWENKWAGIPPVSLCLHLE